VNQRVRERRFAGAALAEDDDVLTALCARIDDVGDLSLAPRKCPAVDRGAGAERAGTCASRSNFAFSLIVSRTS